MVDALAIWAEEGRVCKHDIVDEPLNRRYQSAVSEWDNPVHSNMNNPPLEEGNPVNWHILVTGGI